MSEEEKAIKWLENNTKNYKLKSEELHYILVLFNLITNLKRENQKLKEQLKIKHDGFMASVDESCEYAEENQKYKEVIAKLKEYLIDTIPDNIEIADYSIKRVKDILKEVEHE